MSWPHVKLGEVCIFTTGGTPSKSVSAYFDNGTIPWIVSGDIHRGVIREVDGAITEVGMKNSPAKFLPNNSVLIALNGQGKTRATVALLKMSDATCNQSVVAMTPKSPKTLYYKFLFVILRSMYQSLRDLTGDGKRSGLNMGILKGLKIPLPSLTEQKRIAAILGAADALRAKRHDALAQLDTLLQSTFLDMFGDPVTNPKGWERRRLGDFIKFIGGSQPPKQTFVYEPREGYVRLVQIRDFKSDRYPTFIPEALAKRPFDSDDVMIARYGPPVFQILTGLSGSYNVALMKAEPIGSVLKPFVFHLLSHPAINAAVVEQSERTAGQSGVNLKFLNNYPAFVPPLDLQRRFAATVESVERQRARMRAHLAALGTLFVSIQSRAFNGEL